MVDVRDFDGTSMSVAHGGDKVVNQLNKAAYRELRLPIVFSNPLLNVAALTATLPFLSALPDEAVVESAWAEVTTPFAGTAITALTVDLGKTGDDNFWLAVADVLGASGGDKVNATAGVGLTNPVDEVGTTPEALVTATGANLDQLTAGSAEMVLRYSLKSTD